MDKSNINSDTGKNAKLLYISKLSNNQKTVEKMRLRKTKNEQMQNIERSRKSQ